MSRSQSRGRYTRPVLVEITIHTFKHTHMCTLEVVQAVHVIQSHLCQFLQDMGGGGLSTTVHHCHLH